MIYAHSVWFCPVARKVSNDNVIIYTMLERAFPTTMGICTYCVIRAGHRLGLVERKYEILEMGLG